MPFSMIAEANPQRADGPDSRAAWLVAWAALAILTICYGAPLISVVALKPMAVDLEVSRSGPAAAGALTYLGAAFGGIVAGWLSGFLGIRRVVIFGGAMLAAGLVVSASGGLLHLYVGHGVLMGLFGTVVGMIEIFGSQAPGGSNPQQLAHGISIALYNTGFGLVIAIPSMIFWRHFRATVDGFVIEMEQQAIRLVEVVHGDRR